ncbi:MAG: hypothetical protein K2M07_01485 [Muribaculaceae bacterium]|nr:hypothetical protein [Muribaculaceae bacterium]
MIEKEKFYYCSFCIIFWVLAMWSFVTQEIPGLGGLVTPIRLVIDMFVVTVGVSALRNRRDILVMVSFFLVSFVSSVFVNHESFLTYINGIREFIGLVFMAPLVRYVLASPGGGEYKRKIDRQILIFLILQVVAVPYQAVKYGVGDHGGGTLGDGLSGALSTIVYFATFYLISQRWDSDNYFSSLRQNWKYLLLLTPTFLNETKISFIYLFLFFVFLFSLSWKSVIKGIMMSPLIILLLGGLGYLYLYAAKIDASFFMDEEFYQAYLFGDDADRLIEFGDNYENGDYYELEDQWAVDLPRFFKIFQAPELLERTDGGLIFGVGNGQFKGGNALDKTDFARKNELWFRGTIPMLFDLLIQMGILGVIWFVCNIVSAMCYRNNLTPMSLNLKVYLTAIIFMQLFYGQLCTYLVVDLFLFYVLFCSTDLDGLHAGSETEEPDNLEISES